MFYDTRMGVLHKQVALVNSAVGNLGREFHVVRNHFKFVKSNLEKTCLSSKLAKRIYDYRINFIINIS